MITVPAATPALPWVTVAEGDGSPFRDFLGEVVDMNSVRSRLLAFAFDEHLTSTSVLLEWHDAEEGSDVEITVPVGLARIIAAHILEQTQRVSHREISQSLNDLGGRGAGDLKAAITGTLTPPTRPMRRPLNVTEDLRARDE